MHEVELVGVWKGKRLEEDAVDYGKGDGGEGYPDGEDPDNRRDIPRRLPPRPRGMAKVPQERGHEARQYGIRILSSSEDSFPAM
jgi:hypothetical protein